MGVTLLNENPNEKEAGARSIGNSTSIDHLNGGDYYLAHLARVRAILMVNWH